MPKGNPVLARSEDATRWGSFLVSAYHELLADFGLISNFLILSPNPRTSGPPKAKSFFTGQVEG